MKPSQWHFARMQRSLHVCSLLNVQRVVVTIAADTVTTAGVY